MPFGERVLLDVHDALHNITNNGIIERIFMVLIYSYGGGKVCDHKGHQGNALCV